MEIKARVSKLSSNVGPPVLRVWQIIAIVFVLSARRYTSNGSLLYSAGDDGKLRRYRRYPDHHEYLGEVYAHKGDIQDLDISPYDECILFFLVCRIQKSASESIP